MADSIVKIRIDDKDYEPKIRNAREAMLALEQALRRVGDNWRATTPQELEYVAAMGKMETTATDAKGKLKELTATVNTLNNVYKRMSADEKSSPIGAAMKESLDQLKERVKDARAEMKKMETESKSLYDALNMVAGKFGLNIKTLTGWAGAIGAGKVALDGVKKALSTNADLVDEYNRKVEGAKTVLQGFLTSLGNGDIANFYRNWADMQDSGRAFAQAIDDCNTAHNTMNTAMETYRGIVDYCNIKLRDPSLSGQERKEWIDKQNEALRQQLQLAKKIAEAEISKRNSEFDKNFKAAGGGTTLTEKQKQGYEAVGDDGKAYWNVLSDQYDKREKDLLKRIEKGRSQGYTLNGSYIQGNLNNDAQRAQAELNRMRATQSYKTVKAYKTMENQNQAVDTSWANRSDQIQIDVADASAELMRNRAFNRINKGSSGSGGGSGRTGSGKNTQPTAETGSLDWINAQISELKKAQGLTSDVQEVAALQKQIDDWKNKIKERNDYTEALNTPDLSVKDALKEWNDKLNEDVTKSIQNRLKYDGELTSEALPKINYEKVNTLTTQLEDPNQNADEIRAQLAEYVQSVIEQAVSSGVDAAEFEDIADKLLNKEDLADIDWQGISKEINRKLKEQQYSIDIKPQSDIPAPSMSDANISTLTSGLQEQLKNADFGSPIYQSIKANLADTNALGNLLQVAVNNGLDVAEFQNIWQKILNGEDIADADWAAIESEINAKLAEMNIDQIKLNVKTGNITKLSDETKMATQEFQQATNAIGQLGSALNSIEDPVAKVFGLVAQAIASVASSFAQALMPESKKGVWAWIAAAAAGTATMISTISAIKSATSGTYDTGGIVPGNNFHKGSVQANVESGELILNHAQQDVVASKLQENRQKPVEMSARISGEDIIIASNNWGKRTGRGEIVFTRR